MINRATLNAFTAPTAAHIGRPLQLLGAALLLLMLQILSGTNAVFALLVFALLVVSYVAVLWAGGLETLFGIAIFYLLLQHVLISQIAKVFFWQPADAPLRQPIVTMGVYVIGMASLAVGVRLAGLLRPRKDPLFVAEMEPNRLLWMSIFCTIVSTALILVTRTVGIDPRNGGAIQGGVLGPLKQINLLGPLAVASGTAYIVKTSGRRRSFGLLNGLPLLAQAAAAILGANREASVSPVIVYILTCIAFRFRFQWKHYGLLLIVAYVAIFIISPYALVARNFVRTGDFEKNVSRSASMLMEIIQNPFKFRDQVNNTNMKESRHLHQFDYYSHSSSVLDRYTVLNWVDAVVDATVNHGETGWETITPGFQASMPRFLNPDKPYVETGNFLAHREQGLMPNRSDHVTGITLGFFADAFSSFGWLGVAIIPCLLVFYLMTAYRLLIDVRIWGNVLVLSLLTQIVVIFSEATIADIITLCVAGPLATGVGIAILYALVHTADKVTARVRHSVATTTHLRRQALQRVLLVTPPVDIVVGAEQVPPHKSRWRRNQPHRTRR